MTFIPRDSGEVFQQDLKILTIFKRQDEGSWKLHLDCLNYHPTWSLDSIPSELMEKNPYY